MSGQSGSSRFQALFESALRDYEKQTGIPLADYRLAEQLQNCESVESVTALLQDQARAFSEFRGSDRIMKSLKSVVFAVAALSQNIGNSFPPANAIYTGLAVLLAAFKGVSSDSNALLDTLESIDHFLKRLDIYTKFPLTPATAEIAVRIMVELLYTLAFATKNIIQGRLTRSKKFVKKLLGENSFEAVLRRLDRLTLDLARTTAVQTFEVVYGLVQNMRVVMDDGKASADSASVRDALETIKEMASKMSKSKRDKLEKDIRSWLSPPDPWKNHNLTCRTRHNGTATWFVGGNIFTKWKSSGPSSLLWVHGKPGAGKSVLCSSIIEDINSLRKLGLASLAFFYFREDEKRGLHGLLSSVLVQLCEQSDAYCQIISRFYLEHANGMQHPSDDVLVQCLKDILQVPGQAPVYLVVDGLDECSITSTMPPPREGVLMLLENLIHLQCPNLRICVTSRPEIDIKIALEPLAFYSVCLHDESGQIEDINNYIKSLVNSDAKMRRWKAVDKELVINVLIQKSDGMFRWVYCQILYLRCCFPGRIRHALDELPVALDWAYNRALREIDNANWEFAYRLLQFVAVASRPLRATELADILLFDFKTTIPKFREDWHPLPDPVDAVLSTTSSLLVIVNVSGSPVIQFSHFSVEKFLTSSRLAEANDIICRRYHVSMSSAHTLAAQTCLGILLHLDENLITRDSLEKYPLVEYAARHWVDHARFEGVSENVEDEMKRLFDPRNPHLAIWVRIYDPELPPSTRASQAEMPLQPRGSALHYAAFYGLHSIVKFLLIQHSQCVHSRGFYDESTPLHLALRQGHEDVARSLIEHGADVTAQSNDRLTPLHLASRHGYEDISRLLLEYGADATAQTRHGSTPLHFALGDGREEVVRLLLEHDMDTTAQNENGWTTLHLAAQRGYEDVARLLLRRGADADARDNNNCTPLHWASQHGHSEVVRVLVEHGTDVNARDCSNWTPLHGATQDSHVEVVRLLLKYGVNAHASDQGGWTSLQWPSYNGDLDIVLVLLEHGVDANTRDNNNWTPLHGACQLGHWEVVQALLEHGADANSRDDNNQTPLHLASRAGHPRIVQLLVESGANIHIRNSEGRTPLEEASVKMHHDVMQLLLRNGGEEDVA